MRDETTRRAGPPKPQEDLFVDKDGVTWCCEQSSIRAAYLCEKCSREIEGMKPAAAEDGES